MRAPSPAVVGPTCEAVLLHDLPGLDAERREVVVDFVCRRLLILPSHMRWGVGIISVAMEILRRALGDDRLVVVSRRALPVVGEYFRLIRSLSYAYVWETWPASGTDGGLK